MAVTCNPETPARQLSRANLKVELTLTERQLSRTHLKVDTDRAIRLRNSRLKECPLAAAAILIVGGYNFTSVKWLVLVQILKLCLFNNDVLSFKRT